MKKLIISIFILALCVFVLASCGQAPASENTPAPNVQNTPGNQADKEVLKVAMEAAYKPMEWLDNGNITGFDAELIKALGKEMNKEVELQNVPWDVIFDNLYAGKYDLIVSSVSIDDERKKTMEFSDPYFESIPLILTRKDTGISSASQLSKKKLAVQDATTAYALISKNIAGVDIKKFVDTRDAFDCFVAKEADAVISDSPVLLDFAKQKNDPDYIVVKDDKFFNRENFGIAANKGNTALISEVNAALAKIKQNGEYQKVYDKYFKTN